MPREVEARERFGVGTFVVELEVFEANGQEHLKVTIVRRDSTGFVLASPAPEEFKTLSERYYGFAMIFKG